MQKIWSYNLLLSLACVLPLILFRYYSDNRHIELIQKYSFLILLSGGILLFVINYKYRKIISKIKVWLLLFQIIGVIAVLYSLVALFLIFSFRNGIGF